ncbi:MAG TPA: porin family protein [Bacteroidales bacterium]|nr:porin family protein [Bacteroidales bacterium]
MRNINGKIKKPLITGLIFFFIFSLSIDAQESRAGIIGGLNLSYLSTDKANDNNIIPGFHVGVWGKKMITDQFGIQPEILYSAKGMKTVYSSDFLGFNVTDGTTKLNLNYIDIPVYLTFNLADDFDFHLGPYVGFLMNAHMSTDAQILESINVNNEDDIDRSKFNTLDAGITGGLGFSIEPMTFGFNYNIGLRQVAKDGGDMENLLGNAKNNTIQVYVGLMF